MQTINETRSPVKSLVKARQAYSTVEATNAPGCDLVQAIGRIRLRGDVIPTAWFRHPLLKTKSENENGTQKTNTNAVLILANIIYWYTPSEIRDELTDKVIGWKKKFKADKLQKSYQAWADHFGLTKKQVRSAVDFLRDQGLITTELRDVTTAAGIRLTNVLFVEPVLETIQAITESDAPVIVSAEQPPPSALQVTPSALQVTPSALQGGTYTKTSTKSSTESTHTRRAVSTPVVVGGSKFSLSDCRRYAEHLQASGQGINNPGGFARTIYKSGSEDELIALWLAKLEPERVESGELPAPLDTTACPDCEGRGIYYPDPLNPSKGAAKCKHPHLGQV